MKEITPIIGHWYKAHCGGGGAVYTIRLDRILNDNSFHSDKWKVNKEKNWCSNGNFTKLEEEIPCSEEFMEKHKIINYEIY